MHGDVMEEPEDPMIANRNRRKMQLAEAFVVFFQNWE